MRINNIQTATEPITKNSLEIDVIMTFQSTDNFEFHQEFCTAKAPVNEGDKNVVNFVHQNILLDIPEICFLLDRKLADLLKISIFSNWDVYTKVTGSRSLPDIGHSCKWHFGIGRNDLDDWEKILMQKHGFGSACDMGWVNDALACASQSDLMEGL